MHIGVKRHGKFHSHIDVYKVGDRGLQWLFDKKSAAIQTTHNVTKGGKNQNTVSYTEFHYFTCQRMR